MKARTTLGQITCAIQTLEQLRRLTNNEPEELILCTNKWYLESDRTDRIITPSTAPNEGDGRSDSRPQKCAFVLEMPAGPMQHENSIHHN